MGTIRQKLASVRARWPRILAACLALALTFGLGMYIQSRRLDQAKVLLRETEMPISKVAETVGYDNISYFSKLFRQKVGCQPGEYRKGGGAGPGKEPHEA